MLKRIISLGLAMCAIASSMVSSSGAADTSNTEQPAASVGGQNTFNDICFVVDGEMVPCDENGNWENPETGEYFRWTDSPAASYGNIESHSFEFRLTKSEEIGSYFVINSTSVNIGAFARIQLVGSTKIYKDDAHKFSVGLERGLWSHTIAGTVGNGVSGTISGLKSGGKHIVKVVNNSKLPDSYELVGEGTVRWKV